MCQRLFLGALLLEPRDHRLELLAGDLDVVGVLAFEGRFERVDVLAQRLALLPRELRPDVLGAGHEVAVLQVLLGVHLEGLQPGERLAQLLPFQGRAPALQHDLVDPPG